MSARWSSGPASPMGQGPQRRRSSTSTRGGHAALNGASTVGADDAVRRPAPLPSPHGNPRQRRTTSSGAPPPSPHRERSALRAYLDWLEPRRRPHRSPTTTPCGPGRWRTSTASGSRSSTTSDVGVLDAVARRCAPTTRCRARAGSPAARLNWARARTASWGGRRHRAGVPAGGRRARPRADVRRPCAARWRRLATWLRRGGGASRATRVAAYLPNTEHAVDRLPGRSGRRSGVGLLLARLRRRRHDRADWPSWSPPCSSPPDGYHWNGKVVDRSDVVAAAA